LLLFVLPAFGASASGNPYDSLAVASSEYAKIVQLRSEIVKEARNYIGLKYRYGGTSPETGFDCSGFTSHVMKRFNVQLAHSSRSQATEGRKISLQDARPGDIIAFRRSRNRLVSHVALVVDNNEEGVFIIHSTSRGVVIDNLKASAYWGPKVYAVRDILSEVVDKAVIPDDRSIEGLTPEIIDLVAQVAAHIHPLRW
jgi:cell wall-associated NlpC family hydrolase